MRLRRTVPVAATAAAVGKAGGWATAPVANAQNVCGAGGVTSPNGNGDLWIEDDLNGTGSTCYVFGVYESYSDQSGKLYVMEGNAPYSPSDFSVVASCGVGPQYGGSGICSTDTVAVPNPNTKLLGYAVDSNGAGVAALEMRPLEFCGYADGSIGPCTQPAKGTYGGVDLNYKSA